MKLEKINPRSVLVSEPIIADQFEIKANNTKEYIHIFDRLRQDYDLDQVDYGLRQSYDEVYTTLCFAEDLGGSVSSYETKNQTMFFHIAFTDVGSTNTFCNQLDIAIRNNCGPL